MSIRPEPSPPPCWALPDEDEEDELDCCGRGPSLASCARLESEKRTEFSPRSPRSLESALEDEAAAWAGARRAANTSPSSSLALPEMLVSRPPPNRSLTAEAPPRFS